MANPILDVSSKVTCAHGGEATPTAVSSRVTVAGRATVTVAEEYLVSGCPFVPPCVTGRWVTGAKRVTSDGRAVAVMGATGVSEPTGAAMETIEAQGRVKAS